MEKAISSADFEKMLMEQLTGQMDKTQLSSLTKSIASFHGQSAYLIDWHWLGTPAFWDLVKLNYQVPVADFKIDTFLGNNKAAEFRIIRKGIPYPRFYEIEVLVRNSQRQF